MPNQIFESEILLSCRSACLAWGYPEPGPEWLDILCARLPLDLRETLGEGIRRREVLMKGPGFRLQALDPRKGPYAWFSRSSKKIPMPNWEYYVQVGEFLRLKSSLPIGYRITFEDDLMDIAVYHGNHLVICCEVKERGEDLPLLAERIKAHGADIDMFVPDRHKDDLRKAKYLLRSRPQYLSLVGIGKRLNYLVRFTSAITFELEEAPSHLVWK